MIDSTQKSVDNTLAEFISGLRTKKIAVLGFGISNRQTLESAQNNAAGAIIGSKFVALLNEANGDADKAMDNLYNALEK